MIPKRCQVFVRSRYCHGAVPSKVALLRLLLYGSAPNTAADTYEKNVNTSHFHTSYE